MADEKAQSLMEALLAVQKELPSLKLGKDATGQVGNQKYKYLTLDKLMDAVLPLLNKHGLVWMTLPGADDAGRPILGYHLRTAVGDSQRVEGVMPLLLDRENSQGFGSALTYARRYALTAVLGIVPDEDDDGAKASQPSKPKAVPTDRPMTDEELQTMLDAVGASGQKMDLLLASVGAQGLHELTVEQGRDMMRKIRS